MTTRPLAPTPPHTTAPGRSPGPRRARHGFTLVELVLTMGMMSVLLIGITSAILIASKALPAPTSSVVSQAQVTAALDQLNNDLMLATAITELTPTAITFTVADRGHGTVGAEIIRWAWSGTAGHPLTRQYNTAAPQTIAPNVSAFALTSEIVTGALTSAPRVLMFVASTPTADDLARIAKLTQWSFPVTQFPANGSVAQLEAALAGCDVVYLPEGVLTSLPINRMYNHSVGTVTENNYTYGALGVCSIPALFDDTQFALVNNSHPITSGLAPGNIGICPGNQWLHNTGGTLAPGAQVLGTRVGSGSAPVLIVIETGTQLWEGSIARARRVALPWGGDLFGTFNYSSLSSDARTILKRSLVWAAVPPVYRSIGVNLTAGAAPAAGIRIELVATPRVPTP